MKHTYIMVTIRSFPSHPTLYAPTGDVASLGRARDAVGDVEAGRGCTQAANPFCSRLTEPTSVPLVSFPSTTSTSKVCLK